MVIRHNKRKQKFANIANDRGHFKLNKNGFSIIEVNIFIIICSIIFISFSAMAVLTVGRISVLTRISNDVKSIDYKAKMRCDLKNQKSVNINKFGGDYCDIKEVCVFDVINNKCLY